MTKEVASTKIFCIGFQKTGTTSLGVALDRLGYKVQGYYPFRDLAKVEGLDIDTIWERALDLLNGYDACKDTPWPVLYDRLDAAFPDAKFIHIVRDRRSWIESVTRDFQSYPNEIHRLIYGSAFPVNNEEAWLARYDRHNDEVRAHFAGRADRFISLNMSKGELNWPSLCKFLDRPVPDSPWPRANSRRAKQLNMFRWKTKERLRRLIGNHSD